MKILAIDCTEETCSVALRVGSDTLARFEVVPRRHSERILPMMEAVLAEAGTRLSQLDGLAFARGPGAFTGLRIAAGVIQGAALAADLPVVPVSSLQALAQGVDDDTVCVAFDARMQEVYWGVYRRDSAGVMATVSADRVDAPAAVAPVLDGPATGAGSGWAAYQDVLSGGTGITRVLPDARVHAREVAMLGEQGLARGYGVAAEFALPVYLRDTVAQKPGGPSANGRA